MFYCDIHKKWIKDSICYDCEDEKLIDELEEEYRRTIYSITPKIDYSEYNGSIGGSSLA